MPSHAKIANNFMMLRIYANSCRVWHVSCPMSPVCWPFYITDHDRDARSAARDLEPAQMAGRIGLRGAIDGWVHRRRHDAESLSGNGYRPRHSSGDPREVGRDHRDERRRDTTEDHQPGDPEPSPSRSPSRTIRSLPGSPAE